MDESMRKSAVSLGADGGGKNKKEDFMAILVNKMRPTSNKEGVAALSKEVSTVGMTLDGAVSPCGSW